MWVTTRARLTAVVSRNSVELTVSHHPDSAVWDVQWESLSRSVLAFGSNQLITGHHLGGALVDPVTGALLILGVATAVVGLRGVAERLALVWLVVGLALVAVSHYEPTPSTSRLLTVLPAVALLCGLAVDRLIPFQGRAGRIAGATACLALWLVLPGLNLRQLFVVSPRKMAPRRVVMVMKALQEHAPRPVIDVGSFDGDIPWVLAAYPWREGRYRLVSEEQLRAGEPLPTEGRPVFYVDQASEALADVVQARLPPDYRRVEDQDPSGQYRAFLFVPATPPAVEDRP